MSSHKLSFAFSKLMMSAAWVDGEVQPEEVELLKLFIPTFPGIEQDDWDDLQVYLSMPVEEDERMELLRDLKDEIKSAEDRAWVADCLQMIFNANGNVSNEERQVMAQIKHTLNIE